MSLVVNEIIKLLVYGQGKVSKLFFILVSGNYILQVLVLVNTTCSSLYLWCMHACMPSHVTCTWCCLSCFSCTEDFAHFQVCLTPPPPLMAVGGLNKLYLMITQSQTVGLKVDICILSLLSLTVFLTIAYPCFISGYAFLLISGGIQCHQSKIQDSLQ